MSLCVVDGNERSLQRCVWLLKNDATEVFVTSCLQLRCILVCRIALLLHLQWLLDSTHFELVRVDPI